MSTDSGTPSGAGKPRGGFAEVAKQNTSMVGEIFGFLKHNKKWWLLPVLVVFLGIGALLVLSGTVAAPFIYTLF